MFCCEHFSVTNVGTRCNCRCELYAIDRQKESFSHTYHHQLQVVTFMKLKGVIHSNLFLLKVKKEALFFFVSVICGRHKFHSMK